LPLLLFVLAVILGVAKDPDVLSAASTLRPFQPQTLHLADQTVFGATKSGLSPTHLFRHFAGAHTAPYRTAEQTCSLFQDTPITTKVQSLVRFRSRVIFENEGVVQFELWIVGGKIIPQKPQQNPLSSPSTLQNPHK
jgi:hypothetical protein